MRYVKVLSLSIVLLMMLFTFSGSVILSPETELALSCSGAEVSVFSDFSGQVQIFFPEGGGYRDDVEIEIPRGVKVLNASIDIQGFEYQGIFPTFVKIDVGNDGTLEWSKDFTLEGNIQFRGKVFVDALNSIIPDEGSGNVQIPINVSSRDKGEVFLSNLMIKYNQAPKLLKPLNLVYEEDNFNTKIPVDLDDYFLDTDDQALLEYSVEGNAAITVDISDPDNIVTVGAPKDFSGSENVAFICTDPMGSQAIAYTTITVNPVNDAPVISDPVPAQQDVPVTEGSFVLFDVAVLDPDNDYLSFSWFVAENLSGSQRNFTFVPDYDILQGGDTQGPVAIELRISDGFNTVIHNWTAIITGANTPPVAVIAGPSPNSDNTAYQAGQKLVFSAQGSSDRETEGSGLTFEWSSDLDGNLGEGIEITKALSAGYHKIKLVVTDGGIGGTGVLNDTQGTTLYVLEKEKKANDSSATGYLVFMFIFMALFLGFLIAFVIVLMNRPKMKQRKRPDIDEGGDGEEVLTVGSSGSRSSGKDGGSVITAKKKKTVRKIPVSEVKDCVICRDDFRDVKNGYTCNRCDALFHSRCHMDQCPGCGELKSLEQIEFKWVGSPPPQSQSQPAVISVSGGGSSSPAPPEPQSDSGGWVTVGGAAAAAPPPPDDDEPPPPPPAGPGAGKNRKYIYQTPKMNICPKCNKMMKKSVEAMECLACNAYMHPECSKSGQSNKIITI